MIEEEFESRRLRDPRRWALASLFGGASAIGLAPILVRLSEVGPVATAFYRVLFALPLLWAWVYAAQAPALSATEPTVTAGRSRSRWIGFFWSGLFFGADLGCWHWSIQWTTVANATLLTNLAPLFVMLGARYWFGERFSAPLLIGMAIAFAGGAVLVGSSVQLQPEYVWGDLMALLTALFYAAYLLTVKHLRTIHSTSVTLAGSGLVSCPLLLVAAWGLGENLWPETGKGWLMVALLAGISHLGGQGLITFAMAHLRASFSALVLLWQPVVAAVLAWMLLGEKLTVLQGVGGMIVLAGIFMAARSR